MADKPLGIKLTLEQAKLTIESPEAVRIDEVDLPSKYGYALEFSKQSNIIYFFLSDDLQAPGLERYSGWIRSSFNKALEKLIIYDQAYMSIPDRGIKAGVKK